MEKAHLVITSIASQDHPFLKHFAEESLKRTIPFILVGDTKSPKEFNLQGCDFYSLERQQTLNFQLSGILPVRHYARKNLGYLLAILRGAEIIIETDDDNFPLEGFWANRTKQVSAYLLVNNDWVNVYKYFTEAHIWPRGFATEHIKDSLPALEKQTLISCPIQQGLADGNPDVDAIYRLIMPLPISFNKSANIAVGKNSVCPFNSQNTTWFKEAFPLLYLPSFCSFRMTDIWRSFVAQRIAWTCGWQILFHQSTVCQQRNDHNLLKDFRDEVSGYNSNGQIYSILKEMGLKEGIENIPDNMILCYKTLIDMGLINQKELFLLDAWLSDIYSC
jgi:hypothetical protein